MRRVVNSMREAGSNCGDGRESPIYGYTSGEDNKQSAIDHNLKMKLNVLGNASPANEKTEELKPPPQFKGFSTASGKIIGVSEKALQMARKKMDLMDGWIDASENVGVSNENSSLESMHVPVSQFTGSVLTATISVTKNAVEDANKTQLDTFFSKEKKQLINGTSTSAVSVGPISCTTTTTYVFDTGNQSSLSPEESNEIDDCTRLLLEDISADDASQWDEVDKQKEAQPVNPVAERKKLSVPTFDVRKRVLTSTKRPYPDQCGGSRDIPDTSNPAKHGRLTKKFVPPRRMEP